MLNSVSIMGRLVRDPELRRTGSGTACCSATIANERDYASSNGTREVDFYDIVAWRSTGEFLAKYFTKGQMVALNGKLRTRNWTDKQGNKRVAVEIEANDREIYFCDKKPNNAASSTSHAGSTPAALESDYPILDDDGAQLPF